MAFMDFLFGSNDKAKQFQQYSPEQMQGLQQLFQGLMGGTGSMKDLFGEFNPEQTADVFQKGVAEPSMRNFNQRVMPNIMQSFADQGASSGLANSLAGAGQDLQSDLGSQLQMFMQQARMQNQQNRMGGLQNLMGAQPYQTYIQQGKQGVIPGFMSNFGQGAGKAAGFGMF